MPHKLSDSDVIAIRNKYPSGEYTMDDLAFIYGVSASAISYIVSGRSHKNVEGYVTVGAGTEIKKMRTYNKNSSLADKEYGAEGQEYVPRPRFHPRCQPRYGR